MSFACSTRILTGTLTILVTLGPAGLAQGSGQPEGYRQAIPRGRIASIDTPVFVPAAQATISPETWVFGVVVGGKPRAYALNLLNSHEIVNDQVGDNRFAAVW